MLVDNDNNNTSAPHYNTLNRTFMNSITRLREHPVHISITSVQESSTVCIIYCFRRWHFNFRLNIYNEVDSVTSVGRSIHNLGPVNITFLGANKVRVRGRWNKLRCRVGYEWIALFLTKSLAIYTGVSFTDNRCINIPKLYT